MRFLASAVIIGSAATLATAAAKPDFEFPSVVPLARRQTSGPDYECHASCGTQATHDTQGGQVANQSVGYAIQNSAKEGYCKDESWVKLLDECLDCALQYQIWQWYGAKVSAAAKKCGLEATPKPADGGASSRVEPTTAAPSTTAIHSSPSPAASTSAVASSAVQTPEATTVATGHHNTASTA
jgi:hypothetical protein